MKRGGAPSTRHDCGRRRGALVFWWQVRKRPLPGSRAPDIWGEDCEPICAGLISGAALVGISNAIVTVLM